MIFKITYLLLIISNNKMETNTQVEDYETTELTQKEKETFDEQLNTIPTFIPFHDVDLLTYFIDIPESCPVLQENVKLRESGYKLDILANNMCVVYLDKLVSMLHKWGVDEEKINTLVKEVKISQLYYYLKRDSEEIKQQLHNQHENGEHDKCHVVIQKLTENLKKNLSQLGDVNLHEFQKYKFNDDVYIIKESITKI